MPHLMNLVEHWEEIKPLLKHHNPQLTEDELRYEAGKEAELYERIGKKTSTKPENIRALVEGLSLALH